MYTASQAGMKSLLRRKNILVESALTVSKSQFFLHIKTFACMYTRFLCQEKGVSPSKNVMPIHKQVYSYWYPVCLRKASLDMSVWAAHTPFELEQSCTLRR